MISAQRYDVLVLGGGPAGAAAAIEAARLGLRTRLLDEGSAAGGQVWRPPTPRARSLVARSAHRAGDDLRRRLAESGAELAFGRRVWLAEPGFRVFALGPDGPEQHEAEVLIVATGARERHLPVPGWTLPGVIGLAAATVLLKSAGVLPGQRVVVAGRGPLLALVADAILTAGGTVAAIVDEARPADWLREVPALLARPDLLGRGLAWRARARLRGVRLLSGAVVQRIEGAGQVARVVVGPAGGGDDARSIACDAVCLGFGLVPAAEVTRLLGATHVFDPALGGWSAVVDALQATDQPGLFACGDGAGVLGVAAAPLRGRLAALGAARALGRLDATTCATQAAPLRRSLARAMRVGRAMGRVSMPSQALLTLITPDTIVCRCEGVTRATLDAAVCAGAVTLADAKAATRCGMGACGGQVCEEAMAMLLAGQTGVSRAALGQPTARPPLRPVPLDAIVGDFSYDSLPIPAPAPL